MAAIGKHRLPSVTIGRYHILPMVADGRTPNAPINIYKRDLFHHLSINMQNIMSVIIYMNESQL